MSYMTKHCFPKEMYTKLSQFWVDMCSWKRAWLRKGMRDYRKFSLKRCARLQRKNSWNGAARSTRVATYGAKRLGGRIPPPSLFRVKQHFKAKLQGDKSVMSITFTVSCLLRYIFPHWHKLQCPLLLKSAFIFKVGSHEVFKNKT